MTKTNVFMCEDDGRILYFKPDGVAKIEDRGFVESKRKGGLVEILPACSITLKEPAAIRATITGRIFWGDIDTEKYSRAEATEIVIAKTLIVYANANGLNDAIQKGYRSYNEFLDDYHGILAKGKHCGYEYRIISLKKRAEFRGQKLGKCEKPYYCRCGLLGEETDTYKTVEEAVADMEDIIDTMCFKNIKPKEKPNENQSSPLQN